MRFPHLFVSACVALGIMGSAIYKASFASMTHDESSTYLNFVKREEIRLWTCYRNPQCWSTANNHLLNTALMRVSVKMFGSHEFALRLPNLLLLAVYLGCIWILMRDTADTMAMAVFGIALMGTNPYTIDFFALARGYGMGLGFMMLSLFLLWKFIQQRKSVHCVLAFVAASAAVFANLTYIAYVASLTIAVLVMVIVPMVRKPRTQIAGVIPLSMAACLIFLFAFFYRPVLMLTSLGEFEYGEDTLWNSWTGFVRDSLYAVVWLGEATVDVLSVAGVLIILMSNAIVWLPARDEATRTIVQFGRMLSILFVVLIAFFVISHEFLGAYYPSGRKAIIYFPLLALTCYFALLRVVRPKFTWLQILVSALGILMVVHYVRAYNGRVFREWWYDSTTKDMVRYVAAKSTTDARIPLAVEWIFHPSSEFYILTRDYPVDLAPYSKDITSSHAATYYYLHPDQAKGLEGYFEHERTFEGRWLMRRK